VKINQKCARAVAAILGTHAAGARTRQQRQISRGVDWRHRGSRRHCRSGATENAQDVPIAIQAFTGDTLRQLNVTKLRRFAQVPANVVAPSAGQARIRSS